ncbi:uncharacterized protein F4822DRAFT_389014 [Hypoxylon trugodes]|uniref:uncharacterized protein n=1 Tax=Hypoxylon trugodes TaxID=326681 RepID=UPI0021978CF8|nr:uncharacterized protein F4822DRAFT_389014 [Hypoxylon trugodes]KAI1391949.1 hypothetical protein F4822DRAFT_389014 [Hypoxylon trugodes]
MKNGLRVVRLFPPKPRTANKTEQKPRRSRRTGQAEAKPVATVPLVTEPTPKQTIASPLATHILSTPTQSDHLRSTHTHSTNTRSSFALPDPFGPPHTPFKNPHLKDQPLHWSPRMFKPQMDRHNWTWSDWDSPSQEIEDVTYESEDLPRHDPFKHCPPELQAKLRAILNMKPSLSPTSTLSTDSDTADTVRYEYVDIVSSFSSSSSGDSTRSRSSDSFSSWVELNDIPWDDTLLERWLLLQKFQARRARGYEYTKLNLPPLSAPGKDASVHSQPADEPTDQPADQSANQSANQSAELSSLLRLYTDRDSNDGTDHAIGDNCSDDSSTDIEDIMNRLRPNLRSDSPTGPSANHPADAAAEIQDIMKSLMPNPDPDSSSSSDSSSDSSTGSTGEIQEIMRRLRPNPKKPGPGSSDNSSADIQDVVGQLMARPGSDSTDFIHPTSDTPSAARQHFHSLQQSSLSTACRQLHSLPAPQHLYAARQLPSATVAEPQQSQGSGFGWKSLACVAVAAATVGAGLAYAWLSV